MIQKYWNFEATVVKVIDGDTIDFIVDLGFHVHTTIRTRLLGVDAPEVSTDAGKSVRDWLRGVLPPGTRTMISTSKLPGDKYGRWLATVSLADIPGLHDAAGLSTLQEVMLSLGYAVAYDGGARP